MVMSSEVLLRIYVFKKRKNFFQLFFILSLINPFISSATLLFLYGLIGIDIIYAKILGDIFTSLLIFSVLKISKN